MIAMWPLLLACSGSDDVATPAPAAPETPMTAAEQTAFDTLVAEVEADLAAFDVPGAQIAVVLDGGRILTASIGVRGLENDLPVDADTRFRWASLSKSVTAAVVRDLVDEGTLALDDAPETWIPTFYLSGAPSPTGIVLDQALTHTAGLPDFSISTCPDYEDAADAFVVDSPGPQRSPPGAVWNYSNTGFTVASVMAEAATGEVWADLVQDRVFDPLGMAATVDLAQVDDEGNRAVGWQAGADGLPVSIATDGTRCSLWQAPAGIWGTGDDLARWMAELLDPRVLPEAVAAIGTAHVATRQTPDTDYGYGLYVTERSDEVLVGHDGRLGGFSAAMYLVPARGTGVAILVNGDVFPGQTALAGLDRFLGWEADVEDWSTDPATWDAYAGSWVDPYELGPIEVVHTGAGLRLSVPDMGLLDAPMTQIAGDHFSFVAEEMVVPMTFWLEAPEGPPPWWVYRYGVGALVTPSARVRGGAAWGSVGWRDANPDPAWVR